MKIKLILFSLILLIPFLAFAQSKNPDLHYNTKIRVGAEQLDLYLPMIKGKRLAVVANQTSVVGHTHLVDTLLSLGMKIHKVFAPEHGFRGEGDAGEHMHDEVDKKTGLKLISLYGKHQKPSEEDLQDVDIVLFDIQDVGARFYTYISTMHYVMEACAQQHKILLVLDRPNPNGFYVDGPVLDTSCRSFVGMHPVPIVHGLTIAEYARMLNGEHWLKGGVQCDLKYIPVKNYAHADFYQLPVKPSPNLADMYAVYLYPSMCLFEGTIVSVGRGTDKPFRVFGFPQNKIGNDTFTPQSKPGARKPLYEGQECKGVDMTSQVLKLLNDKQIELDLLRNLYRNSPDSAHFFNAFFSKLAGNRVLEQQIKNGSTTAEIRKSWKENLAKYKLMRKQYLLYNDEE